MTRRRTSMLDTILAGRRPPRPVVVVPGVLQLSGTYTAAAFTTAVNNAWATRAVNGKMTVTNAPGTTLTVTGNYGSRSGLTCRGITFDGQSTVAECGLFEVVNFAFIGCTFQNYYAGSQPADQHSQALAIWGSCNGGIVDGCVFRYNGTTSHIWMSWFGSTQGGGANDTNNMPRNICVKNCDFGPTWGGYFGVHYRTDFPGTAASYNIKLERVSCFLTPLSLGANQRNPELFFDTTFDGVCA